MKLIFRSILISYSLVSLTACNSNTVVKKPENLLSKDKMVAILYDTYLAKKSKLVKNKNNDRNVNYHALIYKKHQTDSLTFNNSLKYYTFDIKLNEEIFKSLDAKVENEIKNVKELLKKEKETKE